MANPFQQSVRIRKFVYIALILALFTVSLLHRKLLVERQAESLQLRESSRGEVQLTDSAIRLTLTGSRGVAVTMLWAAALKEQDRHKWNEVELLVSSITKLQPYFITPWLFQSWNLAFNVAVENDRPRDKYYYISRGAQMLAEGERRNQGAPDEKGTQLFPGNPEMRYHIGFFYQLKLGTSDEKHAMQCLLDLSCINPVKRDAEKFWTPGTRGREVHLKEFESFCRDNPRLVRRLAEDLDYNQPRQVLDYLKDNYLVPARFAYDKKKLTGESVLEDVKTQFPTVPLKQLDDSFPDPGSENFTNEAIDPFLLSRTWYKYAQEPLPPPELDPATGEARFDPVKHRLPKMSVVIFRCYPARAQAYIAECLEEQGWFDDEGWLIREWFDTLKGADEEVRVGTEKKYHAEPAWKAAYDAFFTVGQQNVLYLPLRDRLALEQEATLFRQTFRTPAGSQVDLRADQRVGPMEKSYLAHQILAWSDRFRQMTNYEAHLAEANAEKDPHAVLARKLFFYGNQLNKSGESPKALVYFERALPLWLNVLLQYPAFRYTGTVQEDSYELQLKYIKLFQRERAAMLRPLVIGVAQLGSWPYWPYNEIMTDSEKQPVLPIFKFRGPIDSLRLLKIPFIQDVQSTVFMWSQAALPGGGIGPLPMNIVAHPGLQNLMLTSSGLGPSPRPGSRWDFLIALDSVNLVRTRMGLPKVTR